MAQENNLKKNLNNLKSTSSSLAFSIIIPVYNEAENLIALHAEISRTMNSLFKPYEIIFVNDGSTDKGLEVLINLKRKFPEIKIINFTKNFGQTAALDAGIKHAKGEVLITMDADLQNDPNDIPRLLRKMDEGYDVVSGWRFNRNDKFSKKIFSLFANRFRRWLTKEKIHDAGCTLKVYKRSCFKNINLYGEMHRYISTILMYKGYKIGELKVNHRSRKFGITKYNFRRVFKGLFDLLFIKFWSDFSTRPLHFFGGLALFQFGLAILIVIEQIVKALVIGALNLGPLLVLSVMLVITGFLTFIFGFLAEIMVRMYYRDSPNYEIKEVL
ncbi:MAG: glycosyltransferase family 2 protein [Candidatus Woesearchaeota archaeon]